MQSNYKTYSYTDSASRMVEILNQSDVHYEEVDSLPHRDKLTFTNGFYANCSALFIDIRNSSALPEKYQRPKLARLYRTFISEAVAVMNGDPNCREINVVGDGVWSVINTPYRKNIDVVFSTGAKLHSMLKMLNCKSNARDFKPIHAGIGMSWGRALMVKAGYSGSGINDVVYMGDVVNEAAKLASYGRASYWDQPLMVSNVFRSNLNEDNQKLLSYNSNRGCYHGNVVNVAMEDWWESNCT